MNVLRHRIASSSPDSQIRASADYSRPSSTSSLDPALLEDKSCILNNNFTNMVEASTSLLSQLAGGGGDDNCGLNFNSIDEMNDEINLFHKSLAKCFSNNNNVGDTGILSKQFHQNHNQRLQSSNNQSQQQQHAFSGRHAMWSYFDVSRQLSGYYYCKAASDCSSAYTWPPSTTVAGRHMRDRHPEVYLQIMEEEAARKMSSDSQYNQQQRAAAHFAYLNSRKRPASNSRVSSQSISSNSSSPTMTQKFHKSNTTNSNYSLGGTEASATFESRPMKAVKLEEIISSISSETGLINADSSTDNASLFTSSHSTPFGQWRKSSSQFSQLNLNNHRTNSISKAENALLKDNDLQELNWVNHEKTVELKSELAKLQTHELSLKLKSQKTTEQLLDLQAEMENIQSRNEQLEKRQKNFNNEIKTFKEEMEEIKEEKARLEKQCFELNLAASRRNAEVLSLKEENAEIRSNLTKSRRELDEICDANLKGGGASEDETLQLRKTKRDLEFKVTEIENELEDTIQRNQILEQNVTRLEMSAERLRSDLHRADDAKETEMSEMRAQFQRRLRAFEEQINELSDTNASLLKQNRTLESRTRQLDSNSQASSVDLGGSSQHYKRELRKALALLRDTQSVLAHERELAPNHSLVRQLKEQLEDVEAAKLAALKSRHSLESELVDLRNQLDLANATKSAAEDKVLALMRDKNSANTLAQEHDEQLQELLKKYKAQIQQSHIDSITLEDQLEQIGNLERVKQRLHEQLSEAAAANEFNKLHTVEKHKMQLMELKLRDVQAKLDLEMSQKLRYESIVAKLKEEIDCLQEQLVEAKSAKEKEVEVTRRLKKESQIQEEQINELKKRETELVHRYKLSKSNSDKLLEEHQKTICDLKLAMRRIDALQAALNADLTAGSDIEEEDEQHDFYTTNNDISADSKLLDDEQIVGNISSPMLPIYDESKNGLMNGTNSAC